MHIFYVRKTHHKLKKMDQVLTILIKGNMENISIEKRKKPEEDRC